MKTPEIIVLCVILFAISGIVAYILTTIIFRKNGRLGRFESLMDYYSNAEQRDGNVVLIVCAVIWLLLMGAIAGISLLITYMKYTK